MSGTTLRLIITLVLIFHGIGHIMGIIPALRLIDVEKTDKDWVKNWSSRSWLLTGNIGENTARLVCLLVYLLAFIGFICAGLSISGSAG